MKKILIIFILFCSVAHAQITNDSLLNRVKSDEQFNYKTATNFFTVLNGITENMRKAANEYDKGMIVSCIGIAGILTGTTYVAINSNKYYSNKNLSYLFLGSAVILAAGQIIIYDSNKHNWNAGILKLDNNGIGISFRIDK